MKFGLIGCGAIGVFRAESLAKTPGAKLTAVFDISPEKRAEFARKYRVRATETLAEIIEDPSIDAVIVSTPPNLHREHCELALHAGKHVLCEKPLASTAEDCRRIVETARACKKVLATGYNYRFYPAIIKAKELIQAGKIGEVTSVKSYAGHPGGMEFTHQWVHDPRVMGGGALMDNGTHLADLMLYFLESPPIETYGFCSDSVWNFGESEDNGFILTRTAQGRIGTLHASWSEWKGYHFEVEICGTNGSISVKYPPMMTVLYERPQTAAKKGKRRIYLFPLMQIKERIRSYRWTLEQSFIGEQTDFLRRVEGLAGFGATGIDGLRAVELVNSAYKNKGSDVFEIHSGENSPVEKITTAKETALGSL
jgi:predicted dehydrogenase